jgi:threonine/homoserine/homoserine lactone efflux protein
MASGTNFGVRRTIPHMLGVGLGFTFMFFAVGVGVASIFDLWPTAFILLKIVGAAYMLWLAWKIAHASSPSSAGASEKPFTFWQAAGFQWFNPKAWTMAVTGIALYVPDRDMMSVLWVALIFGLVNLPSVSIWTFLGQALRQWLKNPRYLRLFNWGMALLLVASLLMML